MQLNPVEMLFTFINFIVLVILLKKFLYKPVLTMLDMRKAEIENRYRQAEETRNEAFKMKAEYLEEMQKARAEAQEIINKASLQAEENKEEIISKARADADMLIEKARHEIDLAKERTRAELRDEIASLAILAAGKIIAKTIQPEDQARLIEEFVSEVENSMKKPGRKLTNNKLEADFLDIIKAYSSQNENGNNVIEAEVRSAVDLTEKDLANLEGKLARVIGQKVRLIRIVDPNLIGGIVLKIGDAVIDGSVVKRLSLLRKRLQQA